MLTESESQANPANPYRRWSLVLLLLVCLGLIGYGQLVESGKVPYAKHSDNIALNLASKQVLFQSMKEGRGLPQWRSYQLSGGPALTQPQALYTYPLHWMFWFFSPEQAVGWAFWTHMVLAGLIWFLLGGVMGLGLWARLLMAVGGLFSFKLIIAMYAGWLPTIPGIVLAPLLMAVVFDASKRPRWQSALWMALVGGLCLHSGHLQVFFYVVLLLSGYLLVEVWKRWREGEQARALRLVGWLSSGALLALGMTLYLLVPLGFDAPMTSRIDIDYRSFLGGHSGSYQPLLTLFAPEILGSPLQSQGGSIELWEDVAYFGMIPLLLALLGMIRGWRRPFVPFLGVSFVLTLFVLPFDSWLLRFCFQSIPGFGVFRLPIRWLFVAGICGLALAGVGCEIVYQYLRSHSRPRWAVGLMCLLLLCISVEGVWYARRYIQMVPSQKVMPMPAYQRWFARQPKPFRIAPLGRATINPGWAAKMGLSLITGFDAHNFRHYQAYISLLQRGRVVSRRGAVWTDIRGIARFDLLGMLGVKYIASPAPLPQLPKKDFDLVASWPKQPMFLLYGGIRHLPMYIYQYKRAKQRLYWVDHVIRVRDQVGMIRQMERQSLVGKAVVRWSSAQASQLQSAPPQKTVTATTVPHLVDARDGSLMAMVRTPSRRFLVISEVWHPGWEARIDGRVVPLAQTNLALLGLWVPPGVHQLKLSFRPRGWPWAWWSSLFAMGLCLLLLCVAAWHSRRKS